MLRSFSTLLLLAVTALGLVAGPHPCRATVGHEEEASIPSCHQAAGSPATETGVDLPVEGERHDGCDTACRHACHMAAITEALPVAMAIAPVAEAVDETSSRGLPLFVHPIDHVPLV